MPPLSRDTTVAAPPIRSRLLLSMVLLALLASGRPWAADAIPGERWCDVDDGEKPLRPIARIEFAGNRVTHPEVLRRELFQRVGEPCSLDAVVDGMQGIMDLGLFKSVRAELVLEPPPSASPLSLPPSLGEARARPAALGVPLGGPFDDELDDELDDPPDGPLGSPSGGPPERRLVLRYVVREKISFLAIPRISRTPDGELRTGLQLRWDNFAGRLHEVRLTGERRQEDDGQGRAGHVYSLDYDVPRLFGSAYGFAVDVGSERRQTGFAREGREFGEGEREVARVGVGVARWIGKYDGVRGLRVYTGLGLERQRLEVTAGERGPFEAGFDASVLVGLEYRVLHRESYRRRGLVGRASLRVANPMTGSDFGYHRADLELSWYHPLAGTLRNLNVQARLGISDGAPFGAHAYSIGGGELLRGVAPGRDEGDVRLLVNAEYLSALFAYPDWRRAVFVDVGNVWPKGRVRPLAQNLRAGVGLRYKLRALTRTDLRLDLAWDPDEDRVLTYFGTSLLF